MRKGLIELIIKSTLRTRNSEPEPVGLRREYQPIDSFIGQYLKTLPKIEESAEFELLKETLYTIECPHLRKQFGVKYTERLPLHRYRQQDQGSSYIQSSKSRQTITFIDPTIPKHINEHTFQDIASYINFSPEQYKKVFKNKCFGVYGKEYQITGKFSIMIRKESIGIAKVMNIIQNGKIDSWETIQNLKPEERKQYINNQNHYPILFQELSNYIMEKVKPLKSQQSYMRIWGSSVISDTLVNSILQNIESIDNVFAMADQAIQYVHSLKVHPSASDFTKRFKQLPTTPPLKICKDLPSFANFYYTTPSFKSIFIGGRGGTGKSMILTYAAMYGFKNNWIVIHTPNIIKWTQTKNIQLVRMFNGLFVVEKHVLEWLNEFKTTNQHIISQMKVNQSLYGKIDLTGTHEKEYSPVPNIFYKDRQTYFHDINFTFSDRVGTQFNTKAKWRMTNVLSNPQTVLDILNAGIKNPAYSTCAMGQILHQIYESNQLIVEIVDDFSWLNRGTAYKHYNYYNDSHLFGSIPPYHIAHCRFFANLDGHKIKRGLKIVASSNGPFGYKHKFDITKIMLPAKYEHKMPQMMSHSQYKNAAIYSILNKTWHASQQQRYNLMSVYTACQGNWHSFFRTVQLGHLY